MGKRHMYPQPAYTPPRRKKGTLFMVLAIIAVCVYLYFSHGGSLSFLHLNNLTSVGGQSAVQACNEKVTHCGVVIKDKYSSSLSILQSEQVNSTSKANQFLSSWGSASQPKDVASYGTSFPIVMVAAQLSNSDETKTAHVFICGSDGMLEEKSILGFC